MAGNPRIGEEKRGRGREKPGATPNFYLFLHLVRLRSLIKVESSPFLQVGFLFPGMSIQEVPQGRRRYNPLPCSRSEARTAGEPTSKRSGARQMRRDADNSQNWLNAGPN